MQDRVAQNPGRVRITPENGDVPFHAVVMRDDNPTITGTPLNKSTLLQDSTAIALGLNPANIPTPNDAFMALIDMIANVGGGRNIEIFTTSGTWIRPTGPTAPSAVEVICVGAGGSGGRWRHLTPSGIGTDPGGEAGRGGGSGLVSEGIIDVGGVVSVTVTVGLPSTSIIGGSGGVSSFGTMLSASGGQSGDNTGNGGTGGGVGASTINTTHVFNGSLPNNLGGTGGGANIGGIIGSGDLTTITHTNDGIGRLLPSGAFMGGRTLQETRVFLPGGPPGMPHNGMFIPEFGLSTGTLLPGGGGGGGYGSGNHTTPPHIAFPTAPSFIFPTSIHGIGGQGYGAGGGGCGGPHNPNTSQSFIDDIFVTVGRGAPGVVIVMW